MEHTSTHHQKTLRHLATRISCSSIIRENFLIISNKKGANLSGGDKLTIMITKTKTVDEIT